MENNMIKVEIYRFNPPIDKKPKYQIYEVPLEGRMSVMNVLDYIYDNLDGTIAYFRHAPCFRGTCARCVLLINGKPGLSCRTEVFDDIKLEPMKAPKKKVIRDLVCI